MSSTCRSPQNSVYYSAENGLDIIVDMNNRNVSSVTNETNDNESSVRSETNGNESTVRNETNENESSVTIETNDNESSVRIETSENESSVRNETNENESSMTNETNGNESATSCTPMLDVREAVPDFIIILDKDTENWEERLADFKASLQKLNLKHEQRDDKIEIYIPKDTLLRYCEVLKIRLPVRFRLQKEKRKRRETWTAEYAEKLKDLFVIENNLTPALRGMIINFILERANVKSIVDTGEELPMKEMYPPHDGTLSDETSKRAHLYSSWASCKVFFKWQPIDEIANYCGYKIALYFSWIGFYTRALCVAAILGICATFYGAFNFQNDQIVQEVCNDNRNTTLMCPRCDTCDYWKLEESCTYTKISRIVDNFGTVIFSFVMCIWSAVYLKFWKRHRADVIHRWGLSGYDVLNEAPRPKFLLACKNEVKKVNYITQKKEPAVSFWKKKLPRMCLSYSIISFGILLVLAAVFGIVLYEIVLEFKINIQKDNSNALWNIMVSISAGILNLIVINIMDKVYYKIARNLTDREYHRTQIEYENNLIVKIFMFQFANYYSSLFYIAFFKGKFTGYPGKYSRIFGYRQEECRPGGCLFEISMQLAIIMVGNQIKDNVIEHLTPLMQRLLGRWFDSKGKVFWERIRSMFSSVRRKSWKDDENLLEYSDDDIIQEYLEMVVQFGFVTLFVTAFPLAPFFAFLNNVFEIRMDAKKLLIHYRRPICKRVENIGVWYDIIDAIAVASVFTNALTIALTSNIIPLRLSRTAGASFLDYTTSVFDVADLERDGNATDVGECRYEGYRYPPGHEKQYEFTEEFWKVWFWKSFFVIVYLVCCLLIRSCINQFVQDVPKKLRERTKLEAYQIREKIIEIGNKPTQSTTTSSQNID